MSTAHFIPGYDPVAAGDETFDVQLTCRACLRNGLSVQMTMGGCSKAPDDELTQQLDCMVC